MYVQAGAVEYLLYIHRLLSKMSRRANDMSRMYGYTVSSTLTSDTYSNLTLSRSLARSRGCCDNGPCLT